MIVYGYTLTAGGALEEAPGPTNTVAPAVTNAGIGEIGDTLTCTNGTWTTLGTISGYTKQWRRGGANISGETGNTYVLTADDDDLAITCRVTATDEFGSRGRTSNSVGPYDIVPELGDQLTYTGETVTYTGEELTYSS